MVNPVVEYLTKEGYQGVVVLHSSLLKNKGGTETSLTNHGVIGFKNRKRFRLFVQERRYKGLVQEGVSFRVLRKKELSSDEYMALRWKFHDKENSPKPPVPEGYKGPWCPKCGGPMTPKTGSKGLFWSCLDYPDCKGSLDYEKKPKPKRRGVFDLD